MGKSMARHLICEIIQLYQLVISPVLWLTAENRERFPLGEIRDLLHLCDRILPNSQAEADQLMSTCAATQEVLLVYGMACHSRRRIVDLRTHPLAICLCTRVQSAPLASNARVPREAGS